MLKSQIHREFKNLLKMNMIWWHVGLVWPSMCFCFRCWFLGFFSQCVKFVHAMSTAVSAVLLSKRWKNYFQICPISNLLNFQCCCLYVLRSIEMMMSSATLHFFMMSFFQFFCSIGCLFVSISMSFFSFLIVSYLLSVYTFVAHDWCKSLSHLLFAIDTPYD